MDLSEFLDGQGVDLSTVTRAVTDRLGRAGDDRLLAVGSVVEGLGNQKSDLDMMLVTPRTAETGTGAVTVVVGRCLVDVQILPFTEVQLLLDRFDTWRAAPWDVARSAGFRLEERTVLHRLRHGVPLYDTDGQAAERFPALVDLARLRYHAARQNARTIQVDMVGYREVGDFRSLAFATADLLGQAVDALLAGYGLTNPLFKWRSRLLDMLPADWASELGIRCRGTSAGDHAWNLHRGPERPDKAGVITQAYEVTAFTRSVFVWADRTLLGRGRSVPRGAATWDDTGDALPALVFDVDVQPTPDGAVVGRLNEFGRTRTLSVEELGLALLLDGRTTAAGALSTVLPGAAEGPEMLRRLVGELTAIGFCANELMDVS